MSGIFGPKILPSLPERKVATPAPKPIAQPTPGEMTYGVDVSHYQDAIDWKQAWAMGKRFCFAKASDGLSDSADNMYSKHRVASKAAGLVFGSYHFFRFDMDPIHQAGVFMRATGGVGPGELPLTLDLEWDIRSKNYGEGKTMDNHAADLTLIILEELEKETGMVPIIYTSKPFFQGFTNPERFSKYIPWLPRYGGKEPEAPLPWKRWMFWQYSESAKIGDVDAIDLNVFAGSFEELKALTRKA